MFICARCWWFFRVVPFFFWRAIPFLGSSAPPQPREPQMTDINALDDEGQTQLHRAAEAGDVDEVARLLTDKADPELKDDDGFVRPRSFALRRVV